MARSFVRSGHRTNSVRSRGRRAELEPLEPRCLLSGTNDFSILSISPANGTVVPALPNGQIVVTLSHRVAGLSDGQSPIQNSGTFNPYDVFLLARGPDGVFSAPSGVDGGDLPLHVNVVYHINGNGTSEFVITPTGSLSSDVYAVKVDLAAFTDTSGNPLIDGNDGYRTFLLQAPPVNANQPLTVTSVTEFNGQTTIHNNVVARPDTIQIQFNKPLYAGAAGNGNVQLIANPGPNFTVVPSVAAYNPTTDSIYLTPTVFLNSGTVYAIRVAGQDSGSSYVSDDQGYGGPGYPLAHTFYDTFTVTGPVYDPLTPFQVGTIQAEMGTGAAATSTTNQWSLPESYMSVQFDEPLNVQSLGRYSVALIPRSGGLDTNNFDAGDTPLNATVVYNPNTFQLIIVPSQPVGKDVYLLALSNMNASANDPLLNNAGQPAGVGGNAPYYATFQQLPPPTAQPFSGVPATVSPSATASANNATGAAAGSHSTPAAVLATIPDPTTTGSARLHGPVPTGPLGTPLS
ncbi:MAG: hypothetical protein P4L84_04530 [Isosphaeraceae bacterium]|nr:hypothetical protein [Isosphaeraceae bacterium]